MVDHGAFVAVMSLNGFARGQIALDQRTAMDALRVADRLVVESVSNDIGKDRFVDEIAQNLVGSDGANKDWFLFAIGIDRNGNPRPSNGNPGALADRTLATAVNAVQVIDKDGNYASATDNSFAAARGRGGRCAP